MCECARACERETHGEKERERCDPEKISSDVCGGVLWKRPVGREPVIEVGRGEKLHLQDHMIHRLEDSQKSHLQTRRKQITEMNRRRKHVEQSMQKEK